MPFLKNKTTVFLVLWALSILVWSYAVTHRIHYSAWMPLWLLSTGVYLFIGWKGKLNRYYPLFLFALGILLIPATPYFSDDYYRFYWDGYWFAQGQSVYAATPQQLLLYQELPQSLQLVYPHLNSTEYYAIYTPWNQLFYALPFWLGAQDIWAFISIVRLLFLGLGTLGVFGLHAGLKLLNIPQRQAWWLVGSPLLWVEGLVNLHIEWAIVFTAMASLPLLLRGKKRGALLASWAVALKISTFPFFLGLMLPKYRNGMRWALVASIVAVVGTSLLFIQPDEINNLLASVSLFTQNFEFNGFLYPLVNGISSYFLGYNAIAYTGKGLAALALLVIALLWLRFKRKPGNALQAIGFVQWAAVIYLCCATTIHPWYLILPLSTLPFVSNRFLLAWSVTVFLSYWFYQDYRIQPWWWLIEYLVPLAYAFYPKIGYARGWYSKRVERR